MASSSGSGGNIGRDIPVMMQNKFQHLGGDGIGDSVEGVVSGLVKDKTMDPLTEKAFSDVVVMEAVNPTYEVIVGEVPNAGVAEGAGFVLSQVEKLDVGTKGEEPRGVRAHFLPE